VAASGIKGADEEEMKDGWQPIETLEWDGRQIIFGLGVIGEILIAPASRGPEPTLKQRRKAAEMGMWPNFRILRDWNTKSALEGI
jgi:hypothetical protein